MNTAGNSVLALKQDGTLWSWGYNAQGQLGNNSSTAVSTPTQVGAAIWSAVAVGNIASLAVRADGTLWSWGSNTSGILGVGSSSGLISSPTQVGSLTNWLSVQLNGATAALAVKADGTLWTWGAGTNGLNGRGTTTSYSSPTQVGTLTTWTSTVGLGYNAAFAVKSDNTLWVWGAATSGQLGNNSITPSVSSPVQIAGTWYTVGKGPIAVSN
jgi:hypothetical protein